MHEIIINANDAGRRLDRFLRKYLPGAPLGEIYKTIRKDCKIDSKRRPESYILNEGDVLTLYLTDEELRRFGAASAAPAGSCPPTRPGGTGRRAKRTFSIIYEDDNILIVSKPFGLLTHGDSREKKDHLANQVKDYLIETGSFDPRNEKVFVPAPVNRLDRNTTGIVLFGKNAASMRELNRMIREDSIRKTYMTVACGIIDDELQLGGSLVKDEAANKVKILHGDDGKEVRTTVRPLEVLRFGGSLKATLCEVELITGRSHQIRAHLASVGHPLIGDSKYAGSNAADINRYVSKNLGLSTQLLHAVRIEFPGSAAASEVLGYLSGRSFESPAPKHFRDVLKGLGCRSIEH